jgi:hypothetical protein
MSNRKTAKIEEDPRCVKYSRSIEMTQKLEWTNKYRKKLPKPWRLSPRWNIFGEDGKLAYPPSECIKVHHEELKREQEERENIAKNFPNNIISLKKLRNKYDINRSAESSKKHKRTQQLRVENLEEQVNFIFNN